MPDRETTRALHLPPIAWVSLAAVVLLPWSILLFLRARPPERPSAEARASLSPDLAPAAPPASFVEKGQPGPWGKLEYMRIQIEPPEDIVRLPAAAPTEWHFLGHSEATLETLWAEAGLTAAQRHSLARPSHRRISPAGISLQPDPALLLELTPAARATIYAELARFPQNPLHADPFRFRADSIDEWFADSGLPAHVVQRIRQLIYVRANNAAFSDLEAVLSLLHQPSEKIRLLKTLSRKTALIAQLRLAQGTDTEALARYWGQGRRSKDISVLLDSLAQRPGGGVLDIVHLLPPFARLLLYTFPTPTDDPRAAARDCHWTSLNFYAAQPDDRLTDLDYVQRVLADDYYTVGGNPALGDIILLVQGGTQGVHSCIYVADDVVFTKNGAAFSVPWTLARLENVIAFYSFAEKVEVRRYRRKAS